jgi:hypothetical protein
MKKRKVALISSLALAIIVALLARSLLHVRKLGENLPRIQVGMNVTGVRSLLGEPNEIAKPCWGSDPHCAYNYVYSIPTDERSDWVISFDDEGHVIDKEQWHSR